MTYFFEDPAAQQRLRDAFAEWDGTPFRPFSRAKGTSGGIDCVGFCEEMMVAAGAVEKFSFPRSSADYQGHQMELKVLRYLRGEIETGSPPRTDPQSAYLRARFEEITLPDMIPLSPDFFLMPGDLLILRQGTMFHIPVMLTGRRFAHCAYPMGVTEGNIHDPTFSKHLVALFRARAL